MRPHLAHLGLHPLIITPGLAQLRLQSLPLLLLPLEPRTRRLARAWSRLGLGLGSGLVKVGG